MASLNNGQPIQQDTLVVRNIKHSIEISNYVKDERVRLVARE